MYAELTNEQLLDKAAATAGEVEFCEGDLDRLRVERDVALADVNTRINAARAKYEEAEKVHQEVMGELARRMIAHKVRAIRDWRGIFHLEEVPEGVRPEAHFVAGDAGQVSWLDWTGMEAYPGQT